MFKQIRANGKSSYDNFDLYIDTRNIAPPQKKIVKETIPYKNGAYDFSYIGGEAFYEETTLTYTFDVVGEDIEQMQQNKDRFVDWLYSIQQTKIYDDYMPGYYYEGSIDSIGWSEDGAQGQLTATFSVYPYRLAEEPTVGIFTIEGEGIVQIENTGSHKVIPTLDADGQYTVVKGARSASYGAGGVSPAWLALERGLNEWVVQGDIELVVSYRKEVL